MEYKKLLLCSNATTKGHIRAALDRCLQLQALLIVNVNCAFNCICCSRALDYMS